MNKLKLLFAVISFTCLLLFGVETIYGQDGLPRITHALITSQAQEPLLLNDELDQYPLGHHLEILEDKDGLLTIEDVTSPEISQHFVPSQDEAPNFGFTDSAYWVRFVVKDLAGEPVRWLLAVESNLFFIDVYVPASDPGQYQVTHTGTFLPFSTREITHPRFLFNLPLAPEEEQTIYLRLESEASMNFPLKIWSAEAIAQDDLVQQLLNGFIYGVLLIMVGYNLILFLYLRDRSYLYYVLFLFFLLMSFLVDDGFAHQYLWPDQGRINAIGGQLFFVLTIMAALKFTTSFLPTKEYVPRLHKAINIIFIAFALLLPVQLFDIGLTARPNLILTVVSYILIVAAGFIIWRRGISAGSLFPTGLAIAFNKPVDLCNLAVRYLALRHPRRSGLSNRHCCADADPVASSGRSHQHLQARERGRRGSHAPGN